MYIYSLEKMLELIADIPPEHLSKNEKCQIVVPIEIVARIRITSLSSMNFKFKSVKRSDLLRRMSIDDFVSKSLLTKLTIAPKL